nr:hypothetical protein [Streptomyces sp. SID5468]
MSLFSALEEASQRPPSRERQEAALAAIDQSKLVSVQQDASTFGVLIMRTLAKPVGEYIDVIVTDQIQAAGYARLRRLEAELGASLFDLEVERGAFQYPHAAILGSRFFEFIRVSKVVMG